MYMRDIQIQECGNTVCQYIEQYSVFYSLYYGILLITRLHAVPEHLHERQEHL